MSSKTKNLEAVIKSQEQLIANQNRQVEVLQGTVKLAEDLMASREVLRLMKIAIDKGNIVVDDRRI